MEPNGEKTMNTLKQMFHEEGHAEPITNIHTIEQTTALELVEEWLTQKRDQTIKPASPKEVKLQDLKFKWYDELLEELQQ